MAEQRQAATAAIVSSTNRKKLILAGPGTGKTFTFQRALEAVCVADGPRGLALTFIRNLVADLQKDLSELASVFTFHGYCKHLMHKHDVAGLQEGDYYPPLPNIVLDDVLYLEGRAIAKEDLEARLHNLDISDGLIDTFLARTDYYRAASHTDLVYRVLRHFETAPAAIPSYPLLVVDEYQDFSLLETTFISLLADRSPVLIAGDDDQALYTKLKHASPAFVRALAFDDAFERFPLPYCSRCTSVIVAAVNDVLRNATGEGHLVGRVPKPFTCYLPDKQADSDANPRIIHVDCSTANTSYAGDYIVQQINRIPEADVTASRLKGHPTALVIGPNPFLTRTFQTVSQRLPQARMKTSVKPEVNPLDGYRRIAAARSSRLGWRIILECSPFDGWTDLLRGALQADRDLVDLLPAPYVAEHEHLASLVAILLSGGAITDAEQSQLSSVTDMSIDEIRTFLSIEEGQEDDPPLETASAADMSPDILFTSLVGSMGLFAEHVFVVGLNNGHFPRNASAVTDDEICSLLVALSRTSKRCHLVSYRFFGGGGLARSWFLRWVRPHLETVNVNRTYDFS